MGDTRKSKNGLPMQWACSTQEHQPKKLILPQPAKEPPKELFRIVIAEWKDTFWDISMTQETKIISISHWEKSNQKATLQKRSPIQVWTQFGYSSSWYYWWYVDDNRIFFCWCTYRQLLTRPFHSPLQNSSRFVIFSSHPFRCPQDEVNSFTNPLKKE